MIQPVQDENADSTAKKKGGGGPEGLPGSIQT